MHQNISLIKIIMEKGYVVDLNAKDYGSGIENVHFRLNSDGFKVYNSSLEMNKEGTAELYYYSSDNVGNSERIKSKNFVVDLTHLLRLIP